MNANRIDVGMRVLCRARSGDLMPGVVERVAGGNSVLVDQVLVRHADDGVARWWDATALDRGHAHDAQQTTPSILAGTVVRIATGVAADPFNGRIGIADRYEGSVWSVYLGCGLRADSLVTELELVSDRDGLRHGTILTKLQRGQRLEPGDAVEFLGGLPDGTSDSGELPMSRRLGDKIRDRHFRLWRIKTEARSGDGWLTRYALEPNAAGVSVGDRVRITAVGHTFAGWIGTVTTTSFGLVGIDLGGVPQQFVPLGGVERVDDTETTPLFPSAHAEIERQWKAYGDFAAVPVRHKPTPAFAATVETATGATLDLIGTWYSITRTAGESDEVYRARIVALTKPLLVPESRSAPRAELVDTPMGTTSMSSLLARAREEQVERMLAPRPAVGSASRERTRNERATLTELLAWLSEQLTAVTEKYVTACLPTRFSKVNAREIERVADGTGRVWLAKKCNTNDLGAYGIVTEIDFALCTERATAGLNVGAGADHAIGTAVEASKPVRNAAGDVIGHTVAVKLATGGDPGKLTFHEPGVQIGPPVAVGPTLPTDGAAFTLKHGVPHSADEHTVTDRIRAAIRRCRGARIDSPKVIEADACAMRALDALDVEIGRDECATPIRRDAPALHGSITEICATLLGAIRHHDTMVVRTSGVALAFGRVCVALAELDLAQGEALRTVRIYDVASLHGRLRDPEPTGLTIDAMDEP